MMVFIIGILLRKCSELDMAKQKENMVGKKKKKSTMKEIQTVRSVGTKTIRSEEI